MPKIGKMRIHWMILLPTHQQKHLGSCGEKPQELKKNGYQTERKKYPKQRWGSKKEWGQHGITHTIG